MEKKTEPEIAKTLHPNRTRSQHADPREGSPGSQVPTSKGGSTRREPDQAGSQAERRSKTTSAWLRAQSLTRESLQMFSHKTGAAAQLGEREAQSVRGWTALIPKPDRERRKDRREEEGCSRSPSHTHASQRRARRARRLGAGRARGRPEGRLGAGRTETAGEAESRKRAVGTSLDS